VLAKQNISNIDLDIGELVEIKLIIFSTAADTNTTYDKRDL
jgi:hypothetical protein